MAKVPNNFILRKVPHTGKISFLFRNDAADSLFIELTFSTLMAY